MATIPEVKIKISGDPRGFQGAVKTAQGALGQLSTNLTRLQALSARAFSFAGIGGAASVAGLITLAKNAATAADEMGKLAASVGVPVKELSRLAFAADLSGTSVDEVAKALAKLSTDSAAGGPKLAELGISAVDAAGKLKSSDQIFREVAERFSSLPDGVTKTSLAVRLFGEEGTKLIPLLNQGAAGLKKLADESDRFGKTINDDQVKRAEEFNDNLTRLQALSTAAGQEIGRSLIPAMNDLALAFLQSIQDDRTIGGESGLKDWADRGATALAFVVDGFTGVSRIVEITGKSIGAYAAALAAIVRGDLTQAKTIINELGKDIREIADRKLFSNRLKEQQAEEVRSAQGTADVQKKLTEAIKKEQELRLKASQAASTEELKGAERLKAALQAAWKVSIDGARAARAEAAELLKQAGDAKTTGAAKAKDRLDSDKTPAQLDSEARPAAEKLRSEANFAASSAVVAAFQGRLDAAKQLADVALAKAGEAEKLSEKILNNRDAARLLKQLGEIKGDALKAQGLVREKEGTDLETTAQGQLAELTKVEDRIKALKAELEKPINLTMEIAQAEINIKILRAQLDALKDKTVTVTVNTVTPEKQITNLETGEVLTLPRGGFASGGYTGPGGKYQPAGIVHAGEYVLRQEVVKQRGMRSLLDRLNMEGINALGQKGYANGGLVGGGTSQTPIVLNWPDGTSSQVSADSAVAEQIARTFRKAALSRGRRS
ncbi:hypothetical protein [Hydrogenophaga sp.]|uniref:hypothetical protein n=1 Tax=Hydrogenophaga sp. TaxID=1904254 RepID=UPI002AB91EBC|nr:hypothetical protein [Hydrogenophaga sp.]MDZ4397982.1 hypothetical protein [Hydrogenophaga sp.]